MLFCEVFDPHVWLDAFKKAAPSVAIEFWPNVKHKGEVELIAVWGKPTFDFGQFSHLKCISSLGAGVDHILANDTIPSDIPITRVVDPGMWQQMSEYVVFAVIEHRRRFFGYLQGQQNKSWIKQSEIDLEDYTIGIMGLGSLGQDAARCLKALGYNVIGWSRTKKDLPGVHSFVGDDEFSEFLSRSNVLICFLPLTDDTRFIMDKALFSKLPKGAYVINVARGQMLVDEDLIEAIDQGHLSGAFLDVFQREPLEPEHPFWTHPKIHMTPHMSSNPVVENAVAQVLENYDRVKKSKLLLHEVKRNQGY